MKAMAHAAGRPQIVTATETDHDAGAPVVRRHWPGTDDGLAALGRLTGLRLSQRHGTERTGLATPE
jgi:hypothetical protein